MFVISLFAPRRWLQLGPKVVGKKNGTFLNSFYPDVKRLIRRLQRLNYKINSCKVSIILNQTYLNKKILHTYMAQNAGAAEYTDCISAEGYDTSKECPRCDTKQSNGNAGTLGNAEYPFIAIALRSTLVPSGSTS